MARPYSGSVRLLVLTVVHTTAHQPSTGISSGCPDTEICQLNHSIQSHRITVIRWDFICTGFHSCKDGRDGAGVCTGNSVSMWDIHSYAELSSATLQGESISFRRFYGVFRDRDRMAVRIHFHRIYPDLHLTYLFFMDDLILMEKIRFFQVKL